MKTYLLRSLVLLLIFRAVSLTAQEDHGHTHAEDEKVNAQMTPGMFAVYAETKKYELTLKHVKIEPGEESDLTLYVADYITNAPLSNVELKISAQEDPSIQITTEAHEPGIYHVSGKFPEAKPYSLAVNLSSPEYGADLLLLRSVEVGKEPPQEAGVEATVAHTHSNWWKYLLVFAGG